MLSIYEYFSIQKVSTKGPLTLTLEHYDSPGHIACHANATAPQMRSLTSDVGTSVNSNQKIRPTRHTGT